MKKIRLRRSLSLNAVLLYIGLFCVATYALLEHASISIPMISQIKIPLLLAGGVCLIAQIKTISRVLMHKNYFFALLSVGVLCLLLLWSMVMNMDAAIGVSPLRRTARLILYMVELFLYMIVLAETGRGQQTVGFLFWYVLLLVALNDLLMLSGVIRFRSGRFETYLLGTKFTVAYLHMNLMTLWFMRKKRSVRTARFAKTKVCLAALFVMAICIRVDVMSGILGCIALVVLFFLSDKPRGRKLVKMASPTVLTLTIALSVIFAFIAASIMEIPAIRYLVENVLQRDTTITGRIDIYQDFAANMQGYWLTGYGLGNGNAVTTRLFGYENVQNGVLDWVLQVGIFATVALIALIIVVFRQIARRRSRSMAQIMPLVAQTYMYIILGMIETTLDMAFFLWLALIFMLINERQPLAVKQEKPSLTR